MFLSVTPNAVLDQVIFIDEFKSGSPIQARKVATGVGGKGLDASVALRHLGQSTSGLCCLAGEVGSQLLEQLQRYGITPYPIWVAGETRTALILAERSSGVHTHIFTGGLALSLADREALLQAYERLLPQTRFVVTGGALPPGLADDFFAELAGRARAAGVPLLVDTWGGPLLACLAVRPAVAKLNRAEFGLTFGQPEPGLPALSAAAIAVRVHYDLPALVVTCGAEGILAFTPAGAWKATPPSQVVVNAAGAGDAASAALAWRRAEGDDWPAALAWAAAVSAASVRTEATSDLELAVAIEILPQVEVSSF